MTDIQFGKPPEMILSRYPGDRFCAGLTPKAIVCSLDRIYQDVFITHSCILLYLNFVNRGRIDGRIR